MITINGTIEDATGAAEPVYVSFQSLSTPQVSGPLVIANSTDTVRADPNTGDFTITLAQGLYAVTIQTSPNFTAFNISVPAGTSTANIGDLVVSVLPTLPGQAPYLVWNGQTSTDITFEPLADPAAPTLAAEQLLIGHQDSSSQFSYQVAWAKSDGTVTRAGSQAANTPPTGSNNATKVTLGAAPVGATTTYIFRTNNDSTTNSYLLATVAATVLTYDDWESKSDFAGRLPGSPTQYASPPTLAPTFNRTSGGLDILATGTQWPKLSVHSHGVDFPKSTVRVKDAVGLQIQNDTTGLWHTVHVVGTPAQLALDETGVA